MDRYGHAVAQCYFGWRFQRQQKVLATVCDIAMIPSRGFTIWYVAVQSICVGVILCDCATTVVTTFQMAYCNSTTDFDLVYGLCRCYADGSATIYGDISLWWYNVIWPCYMLRMKVDQRGNAIVPLRNIIGLIRKQFNRSPFTSMNLPRFVDEWPQLRLVKLDRALQWF